MKKIKKTIAVISGFIVGLLVKFGLYNGVKAVALYGVPAPTRNVVGNIVTNDVANNTINNTVNSVNEVNNIVNNTVNSTNITNNSVVNNAVNKVQNVTNGIIIPGDPGYDPGGGCIPQPLYIKILYFLLFILKIALIPIVTLIGLVVYWKKSKGSTNEKIIISFVIAILAIVITFGINYFTF